MNVKGAFALVAVCFALVLGSCAGDKPADDPGASAREQIAQGLIVTPVYWNTVVPGAVNPGDDPVNGKVANTTNLLQRASEVNVVDIPNYTPLFGQTVTQALDIFLPNQELLPIATPAVHNGKVYVGGGFGAYTMHCLDAVTGATVWTKPTNSDGPSAVSAEGNYISFTTESCTLEVMNANDGQLRWARWLGDPVPATPTLAGERVLVVYPNWGGTMQINEQLAGPVPFGQVASGNPGGAVGSVALGCYNASDGMFLWAQGLSEHAIYAPIVHGNTVFVSTLDGALTRVDLNTGQHLGTDNIGITSPVTVYADGSGYKMAFSQRYENNGPFERLRTASLSGVLDAVNISPVEAPYLTTAVVNASGYFTDPSGTLGASGSPWLSASWSCGQYPLVGIGSVFAMSSFEGSRPIVANGTIYAAMGNRVVAATLSGTVIWTYYHAPSVQWTLLNPPALAGDRLVLSDMEGKVVVLNAGSGQVENTWQTNYHFTQQPAVVNGGIYLGTSNGRLVVIPSGNGSLNGWTQWGGNSRHNK